MQIDEKLRQQLEASLLPLHFHELQFLLFCRKIGFGTLEKVAVQNGFPVCALNVTERIDFTKGEALRLLGVHAEEEQDEARSRNRRGRRHGGDAG